MQINEIKNRKEDRKFEKDFQRGFAIFLLLSGIAISVTFFFKIDSFRKLQPSNEFSILNEYGVIGDFIGGVVGTIFSLTGVILLYITLRAQRENFHRERIESNFYEMLKFHRDNVLEIVFSYKEGYKSNGELKEIELRGRNVFHKIYSNIKEAYLELNFVFAGSDKKDIYLPEYLKLLENNNIIHERKIDLVKLARIDIAYLVNFFGLSSEGLDTISNILTSKYKPEFLEFTLFYCSLKPVEGSRFMEIWRYNSVHPGCDKQFYEEFFRYRKQGILSGEPFGEYEIIIPGMSNIKYNPYYSNYFTKYYGGHQFRLGHYYRHLFQTVKYIDKEEDLSYDAKYSYIKTLRAQLSTYEQIVFFINSLSSVGREWEFEKRYYLSQGDTDNFQLITKYNFIKNIPVNEVLNGVFLTDFYPNIHYETFPSKVDTVLRKENERKYF